MNSKSIINITQGTLFQREVGDNKALVIAFVKLDRPCPRVYDRLFPASFKSNQICFEDGYLLDIHEGSHKDPFDYESLFQRSIWPNTFNEDNDRDIFFAHIFPMKDDWCLVSAALPAPVMQDVNRGDCWYSLKERNWSCVQPLISTRGMTPRQVVRYAPWPMENSLVSLEPTPPDILEIQDCITHCVLDLYRNEATEIADRKILRALVSEHLLTNGYSQFAINEAIWFLGSHHTDRSYLYCLSKVKHQFPDNQQNVTPFSLRSDIDAAMKSAYREMIIAA